MQGRADVFFNFAFAFHDKEIPEDKNIGLSPKNFTLEWVLTYPIRWQILKKSSDPRMVR